jgi:hypothetical protein
VAVILGPPSSTRIPSADKIPILRVTTGEKDIQVHAPVLVNNEDVDGLPMAGTKLAISPIHPPRYQVTTLMPYYGMKEKMLALPSFPLPDVTQGTPTPN